MPQEDAHDKEGRREPMPPTAEPSTVSEPDLDTVVQVSTRVSKRTRIRLRRAAADADLAIQDVQRRAFEEYLDRRGY